MSTSVAATSVLNDPMLTRTPMEYEAMFYPYGFPARIRSNSAMVLNAAEVSWNTYRQHYDCAPVDIRMLLHETPDPGRREPPVFRSQGHLITIVGDSGNFAALDLDRGFSFGWVTTSTATNTDYFRQCFLDVMIYPLLEIRHLTTVHAACVSFNGKGMLLAGDSGAGKSSLAYACARRKWTYVSDDASAFVRSAPRPLVIGHPQKFRFREPVGELFPEFLGLHSSIRAYGKPTIEVRTHTLNGFRTADQSPIDFIVFLNRPAYESGDPLLIPVSPDDAWQRLRRSIWEIQVPEYEERLTALRRLIGLPSYELRYSDLDVAIDLLEQLATAA